MEYIPPFEPRDNPYGQIEIYRPIFAMRLRYILSSRNLLRADICEMTGIPEDLVGKYVTGSLDPTRKKLELIAKALNVNEYWLAGHDVTPKASDTGKASSNEISYSQAIDILYKQMDFLLQESANTSDSIKLSCLSNSMSKVAEILLKYLEK